MDHFQNQPNIFEPNFKLIDHLKTIPGLDFETLHASQFPVRLYDPLLIKVLGLNKKKATRDSVNEEMNRVLAVMDKHLSARTADGEASMTCFRAMVDELRANPGKKPNLSTIVNLLVGLSQTRYRYWHTNPQEIADTILQCNIDLVVLQSVLAFQLLSFGPGQQPERLATPELIQHMVDQTRQRRNELMTSAPGPSETEVAAQGELETVGASLAGPSAIDPFTAEENEAVFKNPDLNDMIKSLGDMVSSPGEPSTSS